MISSKWIKLLTNVYWLEANIYRIAFKRARNSVCGPVTKHGERILKFIETGNLKDIEIN